LGATAAKFSATSREIGSTVDDPETKSDPVTSSSLGAPELPPPSVGLALALEQAARTSTPATANASAGRSLNRF
jgi:hypothetical protein